MRNRSCTSSNTARVNPSILKCVYVCTYKSFQIFNQLTGLVMIQGGVQQSADIFCGSTTLSKYSYSF